MKKLIFKKIVGRIWINVEKSLDGLWFHDSGGNSKKVIFFEFSRVDHKTENANFYKIIIFKYRVAISLLKDGKVGISSVKSEK